MTDALDEFAEDLPDLSEQPNVEIRLREMLGRAYGQLGLDEKSWEHSKQAVDLLKKAGIERKTAELLIEIADTSDEAHRSQEMWNEVWLVRKNLLRSTLD